LLKNSTAPFHTPLLLRLLPLPTVLLAVPLLPPPVAEAASLSSL
jgi:hypothetical protein